MSVSIKTCLRKVDKNSQTHPLKLRVTYTRKSIYIGLGVSVNNKDFKKLNTNKKLPEHLKPVKMMILQAESKAYQVINELSVFSFSQFKSKYLGNSKTKKLKSITYLYNKYIEVLESEHKKVSANNYKSTLKHIKDYFKDIDIDQINIEKLDDFKKYLLSIGLSSTTARIYLITLKAVINANIELVKKHPFSNFITKIQR